ncbi:ABC transporter substrate-binding protein [uncultured Nocardioides sp.]|uniref:ABC transporter substrate-binding protein n=1 Tax=uncultured Nocardioides sp. TaxID=198441 RepID=UPI0025F899F0|nr:extracellular solute-binding protein [uncultured Nocardioides sp.]
MRLTHRRSQHRGRPAAVVATGAVAALVLAGCATAGSDDDADSEGGGDGPVSLRYQSLAFQEPTIQASQEIVDAWNADNPDVQVEYVQGSWDSVQDQLVTQFQGGTAPDVIQYESAAMTQFAEQGYLADLSGSLSEEVTSAVPEGVLDAVTVDDQVIAAPTLLQSYVVFANRGLLEEAGVEVPEGETWSWDEFQAAAAATTGGDTFGVGWGLAEPTATMLSLGMNFDATYFEGTGEDVTIDVGEEELALPERIHAMAYDDRSLDPVSITQSGSDVMTGFLKGKYAMTVQGSYQAQALTESAPADLDWVAMPLLEADSAAQAANPQTLSVAAESPHVEEAAAFIDYFMQADNLAKVAEGDWLIPASSDAAEVVSTDTEGANGWSTILAGGQYLTKAPFQSATNYPQWKDQIATPAFQRYLADEIDADQLATELTEGWESVSGG